MICESNATGAAIGILLVVITLFLTLVFSGDRFSQTQDDRFSPLWENTANE